MLEAVDRQRLSDEDGTNIRYLPRRMPILFVTDIITTNEVPDIQTRCFVVGRISVVCTGRANCGYTWKKTFDAPLYQRVYDASVLCGVSVEHTPGTVPVVRLFACQLLYC